MLLPRPVFCNWVVIAADSRLRQRHGGLGERLLQITEGEEIGSVVHSAARHGQTREDHVAVALFRGTAHSPELVERPESGGIPVEAGEDVERGGSRPDDSQRPFPGLTTGLWRER